MRLTEREQRPDLIISDYHLANGKTGIEQSNRSMLHLVHRFQLFSSAAIRHPNYYVTLRDKGYILLHKPVDPMRLRAVMHEFLRVDDDRRDTAGRSVL